VGDGRDLGWKGGRRCDVEVGDGQGILCSMDVCPEMEGRME